MPGIDDVSRWIDRDLAVRCKEAIEVTKACTDASTGQSTYRFNIYTDTNKYSIVAKDESTSRQSYLGCTSSSRKPRAGEDWNRGNDLADGPLDEETWRKILADIVSYELVKVHKAIQKEA